MRYFIPFLLSILIAACTAPIKKETDEKKEIKLEEFELDNIKDAEKILELDEVKNVLSKTKIESEKLEELIEKPMY
ncbi:MAG: hypothetical protein ACPL25_07540, partial [Ignavibacteria bacterium]